MAENEINLKELDEEKRSKVVTNLKNVLEVVSLQAEISEARARIKKASLEELAYALQFENLKNPKNEPTKHDKTNTGPGEN